MQNARDNTKKIVLCPVYQLDTEPGFLQATAKRRFVETIRDLGNLSKYKAAAVKLEIPSIYFCIFFLILYL